MERDGSLFPFGYPKVSLGHSPQGSTSRELCYYVVMPVTPSDAEVHSHVDYYVIFIYVIFIRLVWFDI